MSTGERFLLVLSALSDPNAQGGEESTQLAQRLNMAPATVHRILETCCEMGFARQDSRRRYLLGPKLVRLGLQATRHFTFRFLAIEQMRRVVEQTQEECYLTIPLGYYGMFIERIDGPHPLRIVEPLYEQMPLHIGATRKVMLAFSDPPYIKSYLSQGKLSAYTSESITDPDQLTQELERIRQQGYGISIGERWPEAVGVGAPIFGPDGMVIASMGILGPRHRLTDEAIQRHVVAVVQAAQAVTTQLRD